MREFFCRKRLSYHTGGSKKYLACRTVQRSGDNVGRKLHSRLAFLSGKGIRIPGIHKKGAGVSAIEPILAPIYRC